MIYLKKKCVVFTPVDALIPRGAGRVLRVGVIWCGPHCGPPSPGWPATTAPPGPPNPQHSPGQYVMVMLACPTFVIHLCDNWDRCSHVQPPAESGLILWWWVHTWAWWAEKRQGWLTVSPSPTRPPLPPIQRLTTRLVTSFFGKILRENHGKIS